MSDRAEQAKALIERVTRTGRATITCGETRLVGEVTHLRLSGTLFDFVIGSTDRTNTFNTADWSVEYESTPIPVPQNIGAMVVMKNGYTVARFHQDELAWVDGVGDAYTDSEVESIGIREVIILGREASG